MPRYITLIRFTDQGAKTLNDSPKRARAFRKAAERAGVAVESQLWMFGKWGGALILDGKEAKVLRCVAELAKLGNVRTETLRAFDAEEFQDIIGG